MAQHNRDITQSQFDGRGLVEQEDPDTGEPVAGWPAVAVDALRAINHLTSHGYPIPAPAVYDVLGELRSVSRLAQGCEQLADGLRRSLDAYDVYDRKRDPAESVEMAAACLERAANLSRELTRELDAAQLAINSQGYNRSSATEDQRQ